MEKDKHKEMSRRDFFKIVGSAAGAEHAIQRVSAEVSQLTAEAPRTFQQAASGEDAAADAGPQRDADDVRVTLCAADPDFTQRHAVGVVGDSGRHELC